jgi:flagellar hook-associated protein 2
MHDIAITPGSNDTLASLASYINQQGWGVTADVVSDATGSHLEIYSNNDGSSNVLFVANNTTNLSFNNAAGSSYFSLLGLGITMNNDGTLSINSGQLSGAITNNAAGVLSFFQNTAQTGFADKFAKALQSLTDPTLGLLNMDLAQNRTQQQDLANSLTDLQDRIAAEQQQLQTQYSQVNALLQEFPYQLEAIQLELGITPNNSNSTALG